MPKESLELLKTITANNTPRQARSLVLLKQPETPSDAWFMYVPPCFNEALDIRKTERSINGKRTLQWTQGSSFSFKAGDTLYDTPRAYEQWSEALRHINICLSIKEALSAGVSADGKSRFPGSVTYVILKPDKQRRKLIQQRQRTVSQDQFVKFLIAGDEEE